MAKFNLSFALLQQIVSGDFAKQKDLWFLPLSTNLKESR